MAEVVALVPARGGSRGLHRKNIRKLGELPLIAWSIRQAQGSGCVDRVVVSTDDEEIADVARDYGAEVPWLRPAELAQDDSAWIDVVLHALDDIERRTDVDVLCVLQPTSPLRLPKDVRGAVRRIQADDADAVVSVTPCESPIAFVNTLPDDGCMDGFLPSGLANTRRQDLPQHWRLNGALYAARPSYLRRQRGFHGPATYAWRMPRSRSIDIDDEEDLHLAQALLTMQPVAEYAQ